MLHVYQGLQHVAMINRQHAAADTYEASLPWLLLRDDGRVRRFPDQASAKDEARKLYPNCKFKRG